MLTKISDVLQAAVSHKDYLSKAETGKLWLCDMVYQLESEFQITDKTAEQVTTYIHDNLKGFAFLRSRLVSDGVLVYGVKHTDDEYKVAAHKFWNELIAKCKREEV